MQIFINLGINACDAMVDGGIISFKTKNVVLDEEFCKKHVDLNLGKFVCVSISDEGCGISKNHID